MPEYQYSQNDLAQLAACPKRVTEAPRREMKAEGAFGRNDFELESTDGQHRFKAFFRQNQTFPENFSLGLDYPKHRWPLPHPPSQRPSWRL